jgi:hypothetical protein
LPTFHERSALRALERHEDALEPEDERGREDRGDDDSRRALHDSLASAAVTKSFEDIFGSGVETHASRIADTIERPIPSTPSTHT